MYSTGQTTGDKAGPYVTSALKRLAAAAAGKPIMAVQSGWASNNEEHDGARCVDISLASAKAFFELLDDNCATFKASKAGWMWHSAWSDCPVFVLTRGAFTDVEAGFGLFSWPQRKPKWTIQQPRLFC